MGPVACIEESVSKYRVILDETRTKVNHKIRVRDQVEFPGLAEERRIMEWAQQQTNFGGANSGTGVSDTGDAVPVVGMLKFDVMGAHRLIKKMRKHWRFLVMRIRGEYFCNTVGTFGEGSASYWFNAVIVLYTEVYIIS